MLDPKRLRTELDHGCGISSSAAASTWTPTASARSRSGARRCRSATQDLQNERNTKSKAIGKAKAAGEDIQPLLDEVAGLGDG